MPIYTQSRWAITGEYAMLRTAIIALLAAAVLAPPAAHATDFIETADFSNDPAHPTLLGDLTPGGNLISGAIDTYGPHVGPHGERTNPDSDYVTFVVPTHYRLTQFVVSPGTSILTSPRADNMFLGLAAGDHVSVDPSFTSAAGLLGWTLVNQAQLGTNILPAIGAATAPGFPVPGATTFKGPLGAGTYTLWLVDGDEATKYSFNAVTAAVPEPATWAMMMTGFGMIGVTTRRRQTHVLA